MDTPTLLLYLSSFLLSIPILSLLLLLLQLAARFALSFVLLRTPDWPIVDPHPASPSNSPLHPKSRLHQLHYGRLAVHAHDGEHTAECAVCLCEVEKGNEVREISCSHLFHRECLDGWVEHGWSTCPLCRQALAKANGTCGYEDDHEEPEEDEMLPSGLALVLCLGRGGW